MGQCQVNAAAVNAAVDAAVREKQKENDELRERLAKSAGTFWDTIDDLWHPVNAPFVDQYDCRFRKLMEARSAPQYTYLKNKMYPEEEKYLGFEAVPLEYSYLYQGGESFDGANTMVSETVSTMVSETGTEADANDKIEQNNKKKATDHMKKYLKTIGGRPYVRTNKSKAHLLPDDPKCNIFWWNILKLLLKDSDGPDAAMNDFVLKAAAGMATNKLVFDMEHNHYFDDLTLGNILAIPLFDSLEAMARWEYMETYEMLIACDSSETYNAMRMRFDEGADEVEHVEDLGPGDLSKATALMSEASKILADSLCNHTNIDEIVGDAGRKNMLGRMKGQLKTGKVKVPELRTTDGKMPKVFKICFGRLLGGAARRYIPDPFLLLFKSAVNWSAHAYGAGLKLLPACMLSPGSSVVGSGSNWDIFAPDLYETRLPDLSGRDIAFVSDDENEGDATISISSDVTS